MQCSAMQYCHCICGIDQGLGQGGWILVKIFFFAFLLTSTSSCPIKMQKKSTWLISSQFLTELASMVSKGLYGQKITPKNFAFVGTKRAIPSGQDRPLLDHLG